MAYYILFVLAQNKDIVKRKRITYHVVNIAVADKLYGLGMFCSFMLLLAIIMIVMCLPSSLLGMIIHFYPAKLKLSCQPPCLHMEGPNLSKRVLLHF